MVARAVIGHCRQMDDSVTGLSRSELDITDIDAVARAVSRHRPDAVINCAAYTDVDRAETDEAACFAVNADGVENLASVCRSEGTRFITISTDYVFGGDKDGFYIEDDEPRPLSVYGRSKLEGELRAAAANPEAIVVRTGWVFGSEGTNFLSVAAHQLEKGLPVRAVSDSFGTPTYAADLASGLRKLAETSAAGTFHIANPGEGTSYFGFALAVSEAAGLETSMVTPITDAELRRPAPRPANSRLCSLRLAEDELPEWRDALLRFLSLREIAKQV